MSEADLTKTTPPGPDRRHSSRPSAVGRFAHGAIFDDRYRIIELLGRGGMGEVYRADDLRLGQTVALKFLPAAFSRDAGRVEWLHNEVRAARQVSHPNVCRMYDIGGRDGQLYLSMEYVGGEDLAASLKRIGRFPEDKAIDIGRQLCAGLAAAHERGVLHRDLKPANVMLDADGHVRIMDFSLAAIGEAEPLRAGTPGYMAPEQIDGRPATAKTDVFALGLVLYEVFTGHPAFTASSFADLAVQHALSVPPPGQHVPTLDRAIERAILRCLEQDPGERPHSAIAVMAMLPGSDAFSVMVAGGLTPSPEMVAAAGATGTTLSPRAGAMWLTAMVALLGVTSSLSDRATLPGVVQMNKPAAALREVASQVMRRIPDSQASTYQAVGFDYDRDALRWYRGQDGASGHWRMLAGDAVPAIRFWLRASRRPLDPLGDFTYVTRADPPMVSPGDVLVDLDTEGRLLGIQMQPRLTSAPAHAAVAWPALFDAAGLVFSDFTATPPRSEPPVPADTHLEWEGPAPSRPGGAVHVVAATRLGSLVWMSVDGPWSVPPPASNSQTGFAIAVVSGIVQAGLLFLLLRLAVVNIRADRVDRRSAFKVALFGFVVELLVWVLTPAHSVDPSRELLRFFAGFAYACFFGVVFGAAYLGLEPYVRRLWPRTLISWTRFVSGRLTDPLVGRDVLIGATCGLVSASLAFAYPLVPSFLGWPAPSGWLPSLAPATGLGGALARPLYLLVFSVLNGLLGTFVMAVLRHYLRRTWLAALMWLVVTGLLFDETSHIDSGQIPFLVFSMLSTSVVMGVLVRFGLLAFTAAALTNNLATAMVFTLDPHRAYFSASLLPAALIVAAGAAGWRCATRSAAPLRRYN